MFGKSKNNSNRYTTYLIYSVIIIFALLVSYKVGASIPTMTQAATVTTEAVNQGGAATVSPPYLLPDFTLTSQTGEALSLSELRGRNVLMFFGYTHCPDVCPTTLSDYKRIKQQLGDQAEDVAFVFISVDGKRDTPEVMADYLAHFDADFIGLTGGEDIMRQIGADYGLNFSADTVNVGHSHEEEHSHDEGHEHEHEHDPNTDEDYFVEHTSPSFLVDADGYLRTVFFYGTKTEVVTSGIQQIMAEKSS